MSSGLNILDLRTIDAFNKFAISHWDDVEEFIVIGRCKNEYFQLTQCNKKGFAEILRHYLMNNNDSFNFIRSTLSAVELALCSWELGVDFNELMNFIYYCRDNDDPEIQEKKIKDFVDTIDCD